MDYQKNNIYVECAIEKNKECRENFKKKKFEKNEIFLYKIFSH